LREREEKRGEREWAYQQTHEATLAGSITGERGWARRPTNAGDSDRLHEQQWQWKRSASFEVRCGCTSIDGSEQLRKENEIERESENGLRKSEREK